MRWPFIAVFRFRFTRWVLSEQNAVGLSRVLTLAFTGLRICMRTFLTLLVEEVGFLLRCAKIDVILMTIQTADLYFRSKIVLRCTLRFRLIGFQKM